MRSKEFIREASKFRKSATAAIPGAQVHDTNGSVYELYRFGVALAGSPNNIGDTAGPTDGMNMVTLAYSDADQKIIDKTAKAMKTKSRQLTTKGSQESNSVSTVSPVANLGPVKRKK